MFPASPVREVASSVGIWLRARASAGGRASKALPGYSVAKAAAFVAPLKLANGEATFGLRSDA